MVTWFSFLYQVFGCAYYLIFASIFRKYLHDMVLMVVLSIPR